MDKLLTKVQQEELLSRISAAMSTQSTWTDALCNHPILSSILTSLLAYSIYLVYFYFTSPLRRYPGPLLAKLTTLYRLWHVAGGLSHKVYADLHYPRPNSKGKRKINPLVCIGPDQLSVSSPELAKVVMNVKDEWLKTSFYQVSGLMVNGKVVYNMFAQPDPHRHAAEKKLVAKFYTAGAMAGMEGHVDRSLELFCRELEGRFMNDSKKGGGVVDLNAWIDYYAWDSNGNVTFSRPVGFLEAGRDIDGTLRTVERNMDYLGFASVIPTVDRLLFKNPRLGAPVATNVDHIVNRALKILVDRYQGTDDVKNKKTSTGGEAAEEDLLDKFISVKREQKYRELSGKGDGQEEEEEEEEKVTDDLIVGWILINLFAGGDTTACTIRSAIYYSLKTPGVWDRLRAELASAGLTKEQCPLSYKTVRNIPYLDALITESLRILPGVSFGLERYVPKGGYHVPEHLGGGFLPEKTILSINPYVLAHHPEAFGEDVDEFKPERWLKAEGETEDEFRERLQRMNNAMVVWGGGSRACLGKQLALLQIYKVVATLAVLYDIELVDPEKEWWVRNSWFVRQAGWDVRMRKRE